MKLEALLLGTGLLACADATTMSVATCEDLVAAVAATSSDNIVGELAGSGVSCDSWTSFEINNNRLKLVAADDTSDDVVVFNNVRFVVGASGILRVFPSVEFTGSDTTVQENDGGVLNVADGGNVRFRSSVYMHDVEVSSATDGDYSPDRWHGGCIYNNGFLRFDGTYEASNCHTDSQGGDSADGDGNGIWNGETGKVVMKGEVTMTECGGREIEGNLGGAFYNLGRVTISSDATFIDNWSSGGAIYNRGVFKFLKNSLATFTGNRSSDADGGAVNNGDDAVMKLNGGAVFTENYTEGNGGAIGNGGSFSISKSAAFIENRSLQSGGAIANGFDADLVLPDDTTFEGNIVSYPDWDDCENIYQRTSADDVSAYECLP